MDHELEKEESKKTGRIFFIALVSFFVVFASVDAFFVYRAVKTHTGVITTNAYERGIDFNKVLEQARLQEGVEPIFKIDENRVSLSLKSQDKGLIENALIRINFIRPVSKGKDFELFLEQELKGLYIGDIDHLEKGLWSARIDATWDDETGKKRYQYEIPFRL